MSALKPALLFLVLSFATAQALAAANLEINQIIVDDDNLGNSLGNDDGIIDAGETVELYIQLINTGDIQAVTPLLAITSYSSYLTPLFNTSSYYPSIDPGAAQNPNDDFDFAVSALAPLGATLLFQVNITGLDAQGAPFDVQRTASLVVGGSAIPEPATLALFGLGLAGLGAVRRKKLAA